MSPARSWMVQHWSLQTSCWCLVTVSRVVQPMGLPMCMSPSMDVWPVLNRACHSNTHVRLMFSSPNACLITVRVSAALFLIFAQNLMHTRHFLCQIHSKIETGHIHDSKQKDAKNQYVQLDAWNFVHWLPWYASTTIYCCIVLLQLLHTWQRQSWKSWI
jgi:hypothetical protein